MTLTAADVAEIMRLVEQSSFDEITLEVDGLKLSLRRGGAANGATQTMVGSSSSMAPSGPVPFASAGSIANGASASPAAPSAYVAPGGGSTTHSATSAQATSVAPSESAHNLSTASGVSAAPATATAPSGSTAYSTSTAPARPTATGVSVAGDMPVASAFTSQAAVVAKEQAHARPNLHDVTSPLLGTFYRAPKPGAPPFVEVGSNVEEDTVVAIIEVMKLMNTVRAGARGTVTEILARDGTLVEYGETLLRISKAG